MSAAAVEGRVASLNRGISSSAVSPRSNTDGYCLASNDPPRVAAGTTSGGTVRARMSIGIGARQEVRMGKLPPTGAGIWRETAAPLPRM
ncbi:MAG: hypothetical protein MUF57_11145, partial [Gammaproteobacteria bacterium]|nr:hypothetical protein [Gammaproteobacteria bacterium]